MTRAGLRHPEAMTKKKPTQDDLDRIIPKTETMCSVSARGLNYPTARDMADGTNETVAVLNASLFPEGVMVWQWMTHANNPNHLRDGRTTLLTPEAAKRLGRMLIHAAEEHESRTYRDELAVLNRLGSYWPEGRRPEPLVAVGYNSNALAANATTVGAKPTKP